MKKAEGRRMKVEIDQRSGFCHGVTTAIKKAEAELETASQLYCLGDIVHNDQEVKRLQNKGLSTINRNSFNELRNATVLLRAHGEPPSTYAQAKANNVTLLDATCPVVLQLQKRVKRIYQSMEEAQIVIFGKKGHAEVVGLVGQTEGTAVVVTSLDEMDQIDFTRDIYLFSQTTMPLDAFHRLIAYINEHIESPAEFHYTDTICRQVANRLPNIQDFAKRHDVVIFVAGLKSSNGKVLYAACKQVNPRAYQVTHPSAIEREWLAGAESVGICGATSTPKWLMEACQRAIEEMDL